MQARLHRLRNSAIWLTFVAVLSGGVQVGGGAESNDWLRVSASWVGSDNPALGARFAGRGMLALLELSFACTQVGPTTLLFTLCRFSARLQSLRPEWFALTRDAGCLYIPAVEMAKSKNHTNHNQNKKAHKNGAALGLRSCSCPRTGGPASRGSEHVVSVRLTHWHSAIVSNYRHQEAEAVQADVDQGGTHAIHVL